MKTTWTFDTGSNGFSYHDDTFRFTSQPKYASGAFSPQGGYKGGALAVTLGGIDNANISGMSGGWLKDFTLDEAQTVN